MSGSWLVGPCWLVKPPPARVYCSHELLYSAVLGDFHFNTLARNCALSYIDPSVLNSLHVKLCTLTSFLTQAMLFTHISLSLPRHVGIDP